MKTQPLTIRYDFANIDFANIKELNDAKAQEIEILEMILREIYSTLKVTDSLSMTHFSSKYNFDPEYQKCLISGNVLKKEKDGRCNRWEWISPKEPDKQMALHLLKETNHPLFSESHPWYIKIQEGFKTDFQLDGDIEALPKKESKPKAKLDYRIRFTIAKIFKTNSDLLDSYDCFKEADFLRLLSESISNPEHDYYKSDITPLDICQYARIHSIIDCCLDNDGENYIYSVSDLRLKTLNFLRDQKYSVESDATSSQEWVPSTMVNVDKSMIKKIVPEFQFTKVNTDYAFIQWLMEHEDRAFYDQLSGEEYDFLESIEDHYKATGKLSGKQVAWYSYYKTLAAYRYSKS